ncbi:MAG: D-serine ammonia-lyase [Spirochaetaceae bacterium]
MIEKLKNYEPLLWINGKRQPDYNAEGAPISLADVGEADRTLRRFAPFLVSAFPETASSEGVIESSFRRLERMPSRLRELTFAPENLYLKEDHQLPISGSIKARGGFYEVLKHAESLALGEGLLEKGENYRRLDSEEFRSFFSRYKIALGSTGNLGLSIGIMGARLGFSVDVHMSQDAKQWKKDLLRSKGARVIEHRTDYSAAVAQGRREAQNDPMCHFVDDENSRDLFLGYAVAALRLQKQLGEAGIEVSGERPLFVYLPCGVGGGPGGVAYGLRLLFGPRVHPFFCEPTHAPCMLLGLSTGKQDKVSVFDIGLDCITEADGLAVGRPSGFVGKVVEPFLDGCYTVDDETMFRLLAALHESEGIDLEPSATPGLIGPGMIKESEAGRRYLRDYGLEEGFRRGTHIVWATGGGMVPKEKIERYVRRGRRRR